ncbi:MAG: RDD family protein [Methylococcales bacterium]|jgi:uncharacterized RDD family membrane protein YckC|nr:RDD family protein [Methylococcales bacterium]MBT7410206.1 RDD family protein [Methylococcales bacterium]
MDENIKMTSADGVSFSWEIAGAGSRSYAFIIDWHIRLLLVLVWIGLMMLILGIDTFSNTLRDSFIDEDADKFVYLITIPPTIMYFLYHPILEILMRGYTPGKRIAGIKIMNIDGEVPSSSALLIRNIFRLVDSLPFLYTLGLAVTVFTKQSVRIGDLAAGTVLVYETKTDSQSIKIATQLAINQTMSSQDQILLLDLIDRWKILQKDKRVKLGSKFLIKIGENVQQDSVKNMDTTIYDRLCLLAGMK